MSLFLPRIEINLAQIRQNASILSQFYGRRNISLMGVSKAVLGEPCIAEAMIQGGVKFIADSRIENIQKMKNAGISAQLVLLRTAPSQAESVIKYADISLNTELATIRQLAYYAKAQNLIHRIIIMVEMGDLREGVLPHDLLNFVREILVLKHIKIVGIGCNLACYGGVKPDNKNMRKLSAEVDSISKEFHMSLEIISGGNSANYEWFESTKNVGKINNLRIGESILLGCETLDRKAILGLHTHAFQLITEVIESKIKPSLPIGDLAQDSFGNFPIFQDKGIRQRAIVALGRQDVPSSSLQSDQYLEIIGSSSDHMILDSQQQNLRVGDEVNFNLDYGGLLAAMTSPFIQKRFIGDRPPSLLSTAEIQRTFREKQTK